MSDTTEATSTDITVKPVHLALLEVMDEVQAVGKTGRNNHDGYNFRGIDAVINAVGPAFRKHRILPLPKVTKVNYRDVQTSTGKPSREVTVCVTYKFMGPAGDSIEIEDIPGEAMDRGDKGTAKAMSVAYRIALLQVLCIPTDEPDPDETSYERAKKAEIQPSDEAKILMGQVMKASDRDTLKDAWDDVVHSYNNKLIDVQEHATIKLQVKKRLAVFEDAEQARKISAGDLVEKSKSATTRGEVASLIGRATVVNLLQVEVDGKTVEEHLIAKRDEFAPRAECGCTDEDAALHGKQCPRQMAESFGPSWETDDLADDFA